ncbi:Uncharacterized protein FKW44_014777 [Caligus rogercresseyi]|uniref:Retrovirus-related Pol polyprotein from type-1 retrotransposable element R2 n=1 Tax=Caligus rogercresseyi TaxID=217165 RepID=A0A7T8GZH0_CALRO|nr:Uncharacterized protein FKW44_014777 [Caligus rogercresseyi]
MSPEDTQKYLGLLYSPEGVRMGNITAALRKGRSSQEAVGGGTIPENRYSRIGVFKKGIRNSQYLSGSRFLIEDKEFLAAIQILGGAPFVKSKKARFTPFEYGSKCEACPDVVKNLDHILQMCPRSRVERLRRHDDVQSILEKDLSKRRIKFTKDNIIQVGNTVRKPDLIVIRGDKITIVDPTIISDKRKFEAAWDEKMAKYGNREFKVALLRSLGRPIKDKGIAMSK